MAERQEQGSQALLTALVHLYRGEVARADAWRSRLDNTTNWALTTTAAVISFGLGSATASHAVFLVGMFMVLNFLIIEGRRYRVWDVYLRRVRLLENGLYGPLLRGEPLEDEPLRELASMLTAPRIVTAYWTALAQRIKRAYSPVLFVLLAAWLVKLTAKHEEIRTFADFVDRAHVGFVPGWLILSAVFVVYAAMSALMAWSLLSAPPATELRAAAQRRRPLSAAFQRRRAPIRAEEQSPEP